MLRSVRWQMLEQMWFSIRLWSFHHG